MSINSSTLDKIWPSDSNVEFDVSLRERAQLLSIDNNPERRRDLILNVFGPTTELLYNRQLTVQEARTIADHVNSILMEFNIPLIEYPEELISSFTFLRGDNFI